PVTTTDARGRSLAAWAGIVIVAPRLPSGRAVKSTLIESGVPGTSIEPSQCPTIFAGWQLADRGADADNKATRRNRGNCRSTRPFMFIVLSLGRIRDLPGRPIVARRLVPRGRGIAN